MKKDLVEIIFILDKSGSMSGLEKDTIGGFNSMIEKQKKEEGEAIVTTILFSDTHKVIHDRVNIKNVPSLTEKEYYPGGCTALLDTIGFAITSTLKRQKEDDYPEKTLLIITTDGYENVSKEYNKEKIKNLIEKVKKEYDWEVTFLGASLESIAEAESFGVSRDNSIVFETSEKGIKEFYLNMNSMVSKVRKDKKLNKTWKDEINNKK